MMNRFETILVTFLILQLHVVHLLATEQHQDLEVNWPETDKHQYIAAHEDFYHLPLNILKNLKVSLATHTPKTRSVELPPNIQLQAPKTLK